MFFDEKISTSYTEPPTRRRYPLYLTWLMDTTATAQQQQCVTPLDDGQTFHPPRPSAEDRFYSVTVGKEPGVYRGTYVESIP